MLGLIGTLITVIVLAVQVYAGYNQNKYLGMILPIIFVLLIIYLIFSGRMIISLQGILAPLLGLAAMIGIYFFAGNNKSKKDK